MKGIKQAFDSIASKISSQPKRCVQCKDDDCSKCKGNQNSFDYVFGERSSQIQCENYNFAIVDDRSCSGFANELNWSLTDFINGTAFLTGSGWNIFMNSFYPTDGSGRFMFSINCNNYSSYLLKNFGTMPGQIEITDPNNTRIKYNFTQICNSSCWSLKFNFNDATEQMKYLQLNSGMVIDIQGFNPYTSTIPFQNFITSNLQQIFKIDASCSVLVDIVNKNVTISMFNIFMNIQPSIEILTPSGLINLKLNEITCQ